MDLMKNSSKDNQKMGDNQMMMIKKNKGKRSTGNKRQSNYDRNATKVVYISTPMKVKTSASNFMRRVQELTGRESDVVRIMETYGGRDAWVVLDHDDDHHHVVHEPSPSPSPSLGMDDGSSLSASSSEELLAHHHFDQIQGVFGRKQDESGSFDCNFFFDHQFSFHF